MIRAAYGIIGIAYMAVCLSCGKPATEPKQPNIILIISDDQGWSDYGFMGHPSIETPNLDALAKSSLCFTHGYASAPLCSPSLASLITGLYAHQHGITGNDPAFSFEGPHYSEEWLLTRKPLFDTLKANFYQHKLLTQYLADAGYRSLQTGKWWLGSWQEGHFDQGMTHGDPAKSGRHGDEGLKIGREGLDEVYDFIKDSRELDKPFFIWYAPFLPHTPHTPPDSLLNKYLKKTDSEYVAKYWAMCEWFDQTCGQLMNHIKNNDLENETLVIYTCDNGWIQNPDENGYAERSKRSPYEMGIRTPLMIKWPGVVNPRLEKENPVSNIDIVPTILTAAKIKYNDLPGLNLLGELPKKRMIYAEAFDHDIQDIHQPTKSLQYQIGIEYPWKLILPNPAMVYDRNPELYDLSTDEDEQRNEVDENPAVLAELSKKINAVYKLK